ncbi:MAG: antibiotic biosynthesis monooxygenase [Ktedonobacteraceae bacterium]
MTLIFVQVRSGQLDTFVQKLEEMRKKELHTFPGTVARHIVEDIQKPERVFITLVWRGTIMPDEAAREQALKAFRERLDDVLNWDTAEYHHGRVFMHT